MWIFPDQGVNPCLLHWWKWSHCFWVFATLWSVALQVPPSMGFSRQEYWSGLPFPSPGAFPEPGIELRSPALQADSLPSEPPGNSCISRWILYHWPPGEALSNFLEEISSLSHFIVFLYFFSLFTCKGFLISSCYSLELCIQLGIFFPFSFAFGA